MRKLLCLLAFNFVLLLSSVCHSGEIKIQALERDKVIRSSTLFVEQVKIAAKNFDFDSEDQVWHLTNGYKITLYQAGKGTQTYEGTTAKVKAENIEWQISSNAPMSDLSKTLKKSPRVKLVRLRWYNSLGGGWSDRTALYNRYDHTIREYSLEGDSSSGTGGVYKSLFSNVTDEAIYKAAQEHSYDAGFFSFGELTSYGAIREERR